MPYVKKILAPEQNSGHPKKVTDSFLFRDTR